MKKVKMLELSKSYDKKTTNDCAGALIWTTVAGVACFLGSLHFFSMGENVGRRDMLEDLVKIDEVEKEG
jgi:hypothetical protein